MAASVSNPFTDHDREQARRYSRVRERALAQSFATDDTRGVRFIGRVPFLLRMPPVLDEFLREKSVELGVSVNEVINVALATWRALLIEAKGTAADDGLSQSVSLIRDQVIPSGHALDYTDDAPLGLEQLAW